MARGTWQGSGTWQTSGLDFAGLIGAAVLIGAATAVATFVLDFIWYIAAFVAALAIGSMIGLIWAIRTRPAREAEMAARYAAHFRAAEAAPPKPEVTPETELPAIEHHYHGPSIHIHGGGHDEAARLIRKALTEGKQRS